MPDQPSRRRPFHLRLLALIYDAPPARPLYRILAVVVAAAYTAAAVYMAIIERGWTELLWGLITIYVFCGIAFTGRMPSFSIKPEKPNGPTASNT
jgi:hypothetical protein